MEAFIARNIYIYIYIYICPGADQYFHLSPRPYLLQTSGIQHSHNDWWHDQWSIRPWRQGAL